MGTGTIQLDGWARRMLLPAFYEDEVPKIVFGMGGTLIVPSYGTPDPALHWEHHGLFEGDDFLYSPSHGRYLSTWDEYCELYTLSGYGYGAIPILDELYDLEIDALTASSADFLEMGSGVLNDNRFTIIALQSTNAPVVWVSCDADPSLADDTTLVIVTEPTIGLTFKQIEKISAWLDDQT